MLDRDTGLRFDHDPSAETALRPITRQFLQRYLESDEFKLHYQGNLDLRGGLDNLSEEGKRRALWARAFVPRLFGLTTKEEATKLLSPWDQWRDIHTQVFSDYYRGEGEPSKSYEQYIEQFAQVEIPSGIREYQGDLQDSDLRSLAHWEIFNLTQEVQGAIDLFEYSVKPASLHTIFRAQRILDQPVTPAGGLQPEIIKKPTVRKIEQDGKNYIAFDFDEEAADFATEDSALEEEWERWNNIEVGATIKYVRTDEETRQVSIETGIVQGFYLLAAGDVMIFAPSVADLGVVVTNDKTNFFQLPLVSDIRLDSEEFTPDELLAKGKPQPVEVTVTTPQTGETKSEIFESSDEAAEAVKRHLQDSIEDQE